MNVKMCFNMDLTFRFADPDGIYTDPDPQPCRELFNLILIPVNFPAWIHIFYLDIFQSNISIRNPISFNLNVMLILYLISNPAVFVFETLKKTFRSGYLLGSFIPRRRRDNFKGLIINFMMYSWYKF